jgi:hypothetical protein
MFRLITASALLVSVSLHAQQTAQDSQPDETPPDRVRPMWRAILPGGTYSVALRSIVSVSSHEYLVEGGARVTEVNIDTTGNALARFYYIGAAKAQSPFGLGQSTLEKVEELATEAVDRAGGEEIWRKVMKNYPTSTHAHTVEFRLESLEQLEKLRKSAEEAFERFRDSSIKIP